MEQSTERIWNLIARKFSGDASAEELAELELLLLQSPKENYSMEILHDLWNSKPELNRQYAENKYKELVLRMKHSGVDEGRFTDNNETISVDYFTERTKRPGKWIFGLASLLTIGLTAFFLIQKNKAHNNIKNSETLAKNEIHTKYGSKTSIVLPDGTRVWLNAGSKMYYNNDYGIKIREVNLSGEAYFDVVKNAEKPFIIHAGKINIKVLGTAFNVNCYPEEKNTVTSLLRGSLEVTMKDRQESIILKPNEKLIVSNDENRSVNTGQRQPGKIIPVVQGNIFELSRLSVLSKDNSIVETSWLNNKLVFRSESFEDLAIKMERWYGVGIRFKEEKLKAKRFTGIFEKESIAQALAALQLTTPFTYKINRDSIFINK